MNNKGQSLALFILFIPIIIYLSVMIIDESMIHFEKHHLISLTKSIIRNNIETTKKDDIIKLYNDNDIEYESIDVDFSDGVTIDIEKKINCILRSYDYNLKINGKKENNEIKFKKVEE